MMAELAELRAFEGWSALDRQLADLLVRTVGSRSTVLWLSVAMLSMSTRQGDVCVELDALANRTIDDVLWKLGREPKVPVSENWTLPNLQEWKEQLWSSGLLGAGEGGAPLVLCGERLYLDRYYQHERALAACVASRLVSVESLPHPSRVRPILERWMDGATAEARAAAAVVVGRRFCLITGGPGTGKTSTVVRLLGLLTELEREVHHKDLRSVLLAPTGKAASRLSEAIAAAKQRMKNLPRIISELPTITSTVHRAVGSRRRQGDGTRVPLFADVVVLDEASMVDLAMMRQLLEICGNVERLVVLGDAHQLASVEAGAVLGELRVALTQQTMLGLGDHIAELTQSWRFRDDGGIGCLARHINDGDVQGTLAVLERTDPEVAFVESSPKALERLEKEVVSNDTALFCSSTPREALLALERARVLCAHRKGRFGVETWNERIGRRVRAMQHERGLSGRAEPILVTENSPDGTLRNGDLGIVWRTSESTRAWFSTPEGEPREYGLSRIAAYEPAFVMSIHKCQGSEADEIIIILPEADSPLLSRELLYTAVTRARKRCTIVGTRHAVQAAVSRRVERKSGLAEAIVEVMLARTAEREGRT